MKSSDILAGGDKDDSRNVPVRIIVTKDQEIADRIIRATNSQISIPPSQLKATEKIHRDIEDFLKKYDLYYDRRKNFYKLQGKPIAKIIGIVELAQAILAAGLGRPADARARPSTVVNNDVEYKKVFNDAYPIAVYPNATLLLRRCETYLADHPDSLSRQERNNLRFYLMRRTLIRTCKKLKAGINDLRTLAINDVTVDILDQAFKEVREQYAKLGASDQAAKGSDLEKSVNEKPL